MNRRRTMLWFLASLCLLFAGFRLVQWLLDSRYAVNLDNVARIADGMSEAEVANLLGREGDFHNPVKQTLVNGETLDLEGRMFAGPCEVQVMVVDWMPRHGPYVRVAFDEQGKVFSRAKVSYVDGSPDFMRKVRKWVLGY